MKFGLSESQYFILDKLVIQPLKSKNAILYVFGSRARRQEQPFSDIDLLIKENTGNPLSQAEISKIKDDIENSDLTIKVDLVRDADLAHSYRKSVEQEMILI
jgi:predicted nucleotidyltransferase